MKRLVAGVLAIAACSSETITRGLEEPLSVRDAQFIEGRLPGTAPDVALEPPRATSVTTEVAYIRPRLAGVPFSGWATLDAVAIAAQIEGVGSGYWVLPTGPVDPTQGEPVRTWNFVADFHDALVPGVHRLLVAATNAAGQTGNQVSTTLCVNRLVPDNGNVCDPRKVPPAMVVSLSWDTLVDLDLIVVTPAGEVIASRTPSKGLAADAKINRGAVDKNPAGVAYLESDSNAGCHLDGRQIENVVFPESPATGSYLVYANLHDACAASSVRYTASRHLRTQVDPTTFSVTEIDRNTGTLGAVHANGSTRLGTFVFEFIVP